MNTEARGDMEREKGIECLRCGCRHHHVLFTRGHAGGRIRRKRECRNCGHQFTTYEYIPAAPGAEKDGESSPQ